MGPKPRSAGHFYATGSHLIDAANHLFLAVNQQIDKVEPEAGNTSSHLEVDVVDEELRASGLDLRGEEDTEGGEEAEVEENQFDFWTKLSQTGQNQKKKKRQCQQKQTLKTFS